MTTHRRLREATQRDHDRTDAAFAHFDLASRAGYVAFLRTHARALGAAEPFAGVDRPRLPLLAADLADLGESLPPPLPSFSCAEEADGWGARYTLEGSRLGGAFLERAVAPGLPRSYLAARHGPGEWRAFTAALDRSVTSEADVERAIAAARGVFGLFQAAAVAELGEADAGSR